MLEAVVQRESADVEIPIEVYLAVEYHEIEEHTWYMGERRGESVPEMESVQDWAANHAERVAAAIHSNKGAIRQTCEQYCGSMSNCKGMANCPLPHYEVHRLLCD